MELIGACGAIGPDRELAHHSLAGSVRSMLVIRTFEVWTHDGDVRGALGLACNPLDDLRLALMSTALVESLAIGMMLAGTSQPGRTARIELTGTGGGRAFEVPLSFGEAAGDVDLTIEADAFELCRLASKRLAADEIELVVEGDRSLLEPVLVGAAAFAMD
jgi:hypothetical protein